MGIVRGFCGYRRENSFQKVAAKWWEWWAVGKSPRHVEYVLKRLKSGVFPAIGHSFMASITAAAVRTVLANKKRGARDVAKRAPRL